MKGWFGPIIVGLIGCTSSASEVGTNDAATGPRNDASADAATANGSIAWAKQIGGGTYVTDLATRPSGGVVVVGGMGDVPIGSTDPAHPCGANDGFVAAYEEDGALAWLRCDRPFRAVDVLVANDGAIVTLEANDATTPPTLAIARTSADGARRAVYDAKEPAWVASYALDGKGVAYVAALFYDPRDPVFASPARAVLFAVGAGATRAWMEVLSPGNPLPSTGEELSPEGITVTANGDVMMNAWNGVGSIDLAGSGVVVAEQGPFTATFSAVDGAPRAVRPVFESFEGLSPNVTGSTKGLVIPAVCTTGSRFGDADQTCASCGEAWGCVDALDASGKAAWWAATTDVEGAASDVAYDGAGNDVFVASQEIAGNDARPQIAGFDAMTGAKTFGPFRPTDAPLVTPANAHPVYPQIAVTRHGAVVMAGGFAGTARFGKYTLTSEGEDSYLVKVVR